MLGHPGLIEAQFFDLDDLLEYRAIESRQSPINFWHVGRQSMRAEFHDANVLPGRGGFRSATELEFFSSWQAQPAVC
jgi:hypothetical protein